MNHPHLTKRAIAPQWLVVRRFVAMLVFMLAGFCAFAQDPGTLYYGRLQAYNLTTAQRLALTNGPFENGHLLNGQIIYDTSLGQNYQYIDGAWQVVGSSGGGSQTPWTQTINGATYGLTNAGGLTLLLQTNFTVVTNTIGGDQVYVAFPKPMPNAPLPLGIYFHGFGETASSSFVYNTSIPTFQAEAIQAVAQPMIWVWSDAAGNNWANQASRNAYSNAFFMVKTNTSLGGISYSLNGKTLAWGASMGGLDAQWFSSTNGFGPGVTLWGTYMVFNLNWIYFNNTSFSNSINTAYSTSAAGFSAATANYDPARQNSNWWAGLNVIDYASYQDNTVNAVSNTFLFNSNIVSIAGQLSDWQSTGDHGDPSNFDTNHMLPFARVYTSPGNVLPVTRNDTLVYTFPNGATTVGARINFGSNTFVVHTGPNMNIMISPFDGVNYIQGFNDAGNAFETNIGLVGVQSINQFAANCLLLLGNGGLNNDVEFTSPVGWFQPNPAFAIDMLGSQIWSDIANAGGFHYIRGVVSGEDGYTFGINGTGSPIGDGLQSHTIGLATITGNDPIQYSMGGRVAFQSVLGEAFSVNTSSNLGTFTVATQTNSSSTNTYFFWINTSGTNIPTLQFGTTNAAGGPVIITNWRVEGLESANLAFDPNNNKTFTQNGNLALGGSLNASNLTAYSLNGGGNTFAGINVQGQIVRTNGGSSGTVTSAGLNVDAAGVLTSIAGTPITTSGSFTPTFSAAIVKLHTNDGSSLTNLNDFALTTIPQINEQFQETSSGLPAGWTYSLYSQANIPARNGSGLLITNNLADPAVTWVYNNAVYNGGHNFHIHCDFAVEQTNGVAGEIGFGTKSGNPNDDNSSVVFFYPIPNAFCGTIGLYNGVSTNINAARNDNDLAAAAVYPMSTALGQFFGADVFVDDDSVSAVMSNKTTGQIATFSWKQDVSSSTTTNGYFGSSGNFGIWQAGGSYLVTNYNVTLVVPKKIDCLVWGDSIAGIGARGEDFESGWGYLVRHDLASLGLSTVIFGCGSDLSVQSSNELAQVIAMNATNLVLYAAGGNDAAFSVTSYLTNLPAIKTILGATKTVWIAPTARTATDEHALAYWMLTNNFPNFIDAFSATKTSEASSMLSLYTNSFDQIHPNAEGHQAVETAVRNWLRQNGYPLP